MGRPQVHAWLLVLPLLLTSGSLTAGGLDSCFTLPETGRREACFRDHLDSLGSVVDDLQTSISEHASDTLQVLDLLEQRYADLVRGRADIHARLLDIRGQALARLGRYDAAAAALARAVELDDGAARLRWLGPDESTRWSQVVDAGDGRIERAARYALESGEPERARPFEERLLELGGDVLREGTERQDAVAPARYRRPLDIRPWHRPLPEVGIPLIGGGVLTPEEMRGKVIALDFWATWCAPCLEQLPNLQRMHASEKDNGLLAVAVNVDEQPYVVAPFVEDLGLTMPVGTYTPTLREAYDVRTLPTLIVADREGRVHGRWDGHEHGQEDEVSHLLQRLLSGVEEPPLHAAEVVAGAGFLELQWMRELPTTTGGVTILPDPSGNKILVSQVRALAIYQNDGQNGRQWKASSLAGRLRVLPMDDAGEFRVVGFRQGATHIVVVELPEGTLREYDVGSPVLDATFSGTGETTRVVVGAIDGLFSLRLSDDTIERLDGFDEVSDVESVGEGGDARILVLSRVDRELRRLTRLDSRAKPVDSLNRGRDAWTLVTSAEASDGIGVAPAEVIAAVTGRFSGGAGGQVAVATRGGQLVVVDRTTGKPRFRARWNGISDLASGDLNGDGHDELVVAAGHRLAVLSSPE